MPEMFRVLPPAEALQVLFARLPSDVRAEQIPTADALDRVPAESLVAGSPLPSFARSTMDGHAVRSADTWGASESLPAYLALIGEVPMARASDLVIGLGQTVPIHTGGMIPSGADAVVMMETTCAPSGNSSMISEFTTQRVTFRILPLMTFLALSFIRSSLAGVCLYYL